MVNLDIYYFFIKVWFLKKISRCKFFSSQVTKMAAQDGKYLLESWLKVSNRSLTATQMLEVLDAFNECPYPLFLKVCIENWNKFPYSIRDLVSPRISNN